ncbi:GMC family oxidoreductase N-terminal domain-containing protein [Micromonospora sp. WMMD558]|uniref:GMC family oxidoreductase N-terminal domain-containing protein n=1 Tax=Micromonospora sp. WMMD558 TaxID=3403462 RepID=UPI003BF5C802
MTERCDVAVIGSGFGGAIPAYYTAAAGARTVVLERGPYVSAADVRHSMQLGSVGRIVDAIEGDGLTVIAGNCVGGSSVVYFAASLRAPTVTFERTGSTGRRLWPAALSRATLDPWYRRVEAALPVTTPDWPDVSYAGGVFAAACRHTGHTANPVPLAVDLPRCTNCNWMLSGCHVDAKRSMLLSYLPAATAHGADVRPLHEVQTISPASTPGHRYRVTYTVVDPDDYRIVRSTGCLEARVVVLAAGAVGTPVLLRRSAPLLGGVPAAVGRYLSGNGDRITVADVSEAAVADLLDLRRGPGGAYDAHHIGRAITAMTYDHLDGGRPEFERFGLQQLAFPALTNLLAGAPGWYGVAKKELRSRWRSWLTVLAMTEDDNEGTFGVPPLTGSFTRVTNGLGLGGFSYAPTAATRDGWARADATVRRIFGGGLATVHPWTAEVGGAVTAHPLGSCRLGDDPATSALTPDHVLRGHPDLFVTDASAVPAALTVNPSLTIAALAERASETVLARLAALGVAPRRKIPPPG